jgi:ribokinase
VREPQILVLGAINQDEVARVVRHPLPGETVVTDSIDFFQGGKGANQAFAAAATGLPVGVKMIAAIGDDAAGISALESLRSVGVDVSLVRTVVEVPTGRAYITVSADGQNSIVVGLGANGFVSPSGIPSTTRADVLVAQTEVGAAPVQALARLAVSSGARFILNDGPVVELDASTLRAADPLIVNEFEVRELLGEHDDDPAALALRVRNVFGARSVIVTLGARGSVVADEAGVRHHAAVHVTNVVDTTGAGDVFVGTFAAAVATGADNDFAIRRGGEAAALAVTWKGARAPAGTRNSDSIAYERTSI